MQNRTQRLIGRTNRTPGHLARAKGSMSVRPAGNSAGHPDKRCPVTAANSASAGLAAGGLEGVVCAQRPEPLTPDSRIAGAPGSPASGVGTVGEKSRAHAARLATDPRFAGWLGLMAQDDPAPAIAEAAQRRIAEQLELTRRAKYSFLLWAQDNQETDPAAIAEARQFLADHPPLQRPLGTGEPA